MLLLFDLKIPDLQAVVASGDWCAVSEESSKRAWDYIEPYVGLEVTVVPYEMLMNMLNM